MITCTWDTGATSKLRHVTLDALAVNKGKILLVKRSADSSREAGKYALPGGFLDLNETPIEGVSRELLEETGYKAETVTLFKIIASPHRRNSQTQDVDFAFIVEVNPEKAGEPDNEVSEVRWFELENLPHPDEIAFDHYDIIQLYMDYLKQKFILPAFDI
jgi:ADP-ribose pyrophosphatase YjhB (NUDIX family)